MTQRFDLSSRTPGLTFPSEKKAAQHDDEGKRQYGQRWLGEKKEVNPPRPRIANPRYSVAPASSASAKLNVILKAHHSAA